ncbi:MAG: sigma factor, partial [Planctomycetota bacterium]
MTAQNTMRLRLERHAEFLRARVRRSAPRALLAMESVEDLVQEVHTRVLDRPDAYVEHEGVPFEAWLGRVATRVVQDRRDYFRALKRDGAKVLRLAFSSSESAQELLKDVAASVTGPLTFAARREQLHLAARALDTLMERDRWLIEGVCSGRDLRTDAA